jgi:hypothetical protein
MTGRTAVAAIGSGGLDGANLYSLKPFAQAGNQAEMFQIGMVLGVDRGCSRYVGQ